MGGVRGVVKRYEMEREGLTIGKKCERIASRSSLDRTL